MLMVVMWITSCDKKRKKNKENKHYATHNSSWGLEDL